MTDTNPMSNITELSLWIGNPYHKGEAAPLNLSILNGGMVQGRLPSHLWEKSDRWRAYTSGVLPADQQRTWGAELFEAVFQGALLPVYHQARGASREARGRMRIRVVTANPEAAHLPWELLFDPEAGGGRGLFLCQWPWFEVIHTLPDAQEVSPLAGEPTSSPRVVIASASPTDMIPLDVKSELDRAISLLESYKQTGQIQLDIVSGVTRRKLREALREPVTLLHFIGHASVREGTGVLFLETEHGKAEVLQPEELLAMVGSTPPRMVFLNACRTGEMYAGLWSTASILLAAGTSSVITNHTALLDRQAPLLAEEIYRSLIAGLPAERAVVKARGALLAEFGEKDAEWYTPRVFLRDTGVQNLFALRPFSVSQSTWCFEMRVAGSLQGTELSPDETQNRNNVSQMMHNLFSVFGSWELTAKIQIRKVLGAKAEILHPHCLAIRDSLAFTWKLGEDLAQTAADTAAYALQTPLIQAFVRIYEGQSRVWQSPPLEIYPPSLGQAATEGDLLRMIPYTGSSLPSGEYRWELVIDYPVRGLRNRHTQQRHLLQSAFRLLSKAEWETYQTMLANLPDGPHPERDLLAGALAESLGLYDDAIAAYERTFQTEGLQPEAIARLKAVWARRTWGILKPDGDKHLRFPIPHFAEHANRYLSPGG